jgi:subtilisin family serine protease
LLTLTLLVSACGGPGFTADGDPLAADQYAIDQHGMERAWTRSSGADVVIAIVDTGIDLDHPDLADRIVAGYDFVDDDDVPDDQNGHGTHVAGSAAAIGNNDIGVIGMAPEAKIMPLKVLAADGSGSVEDVAAAITWAADNGADVINLSLGGSSNLLGRLFNKVDPTNTAIADAVRKGAVVVAAAGNDDAFLTAFNPDTPVIVVNATNERGETARFSNFGDPRAVSAAGARIISTAPTYPTTIWPDGSEGYESLDGTSMASPHVAGIVALMVGAGLRSPNQIWDRLTDTASNPTNDPLLGAGIVQADKAVPTTLLRQLLTVAGIALVVVLVVSLVGRRRDPEVENG